MQGTTRSVEAVEGVAAARAMASGGIVSPSASAGGKSSSVVVNNGGGGRRFKRKSLPGGHSTASNIIGKKKLCSSSTNEIVKPAEAAAVKSNSSGGLVAMEEKKERIDGDFVGDLSLEDAALTLTEFCILAHEPVVFSPPPKSTELSSGRQSLPAAFPQWTIKKLRSGRTKRLESSSNEGSHNAIAMDSSSPPPLLLQKQQASECSSSPGGDSQSVITLVKGEDDVLCSSTRVEEEEQVEQHKVEVVVEEQENINNRSCPSDSQGLHNLTSISSIESLLPDSRAESPSSPLPAVLQKGEFASICVVPKFEGNPSGRSAFQRVVPIRPVKKPTLSRKLKVEEKTFEDLNPDQAAVKHVSRKKPRPTGFVPLPQNQQQQQQQQPQQLAPVKIEEADAFCPLALGPPRLSGAEEEEVKKVGVTSSIAPAAVVVEERTVKLDPVAIKLETKPSGKLGQRAASKPKPALSENEKEARKQRRVQANRESARLTIRKKQVLCEELSRKSQVLSTENEALKKEVERTRLKCNSISEVNAKLKEQIGKAAGKQEPGSSLPAPASMEKAPDGMLQYQFPPQFGGLPIPPQYWACAVMAQAQALAQAAQAGVQPSGINMGSAEYTNAIFSAAAAACGNNPQVGFWNMTSSSSSQGQLSMLSPFYPGHQPGASVASALPPSGSTPASISPITRSVSLPAGPTDNCFSLAASERSLPSGKPVASYRSEDFADSVHLSNDLKRNAMKQDSAHQGSGFSGRTHYFQMTPGSQMASMATRKPGEGSGLPLSSASGQLLSRSHSLSTTPKLHSRFPMFGSGGMSVTQEQPSARESEVHRAAAAATEARRKRIELKRTKSILNRQVARVAEPSASQCPT